MELIGNSIQYLERTKSRDVHHSTRVNRNGYTYIIVVVIVLLR